MNVIAALGAMVVLGAASSAVGAASPAADASPESESEESSSPHPTPSEEPQYEVDLEKSSHVVRREEERLNFRYHTDLWSYEGMVASLTPRFREDREQIGFSASRAFGWGDLIVLGRFADKPVGDEVVGSVGYKKVSGESTYGVELTVAQADFSIDDFFVGDGESVFSGRLFWRRENGLEISVFGAASATFDLTRRPEDLLQRLPRSEIAGAETLADLYIDEESLEDSAGLSIGFARNAWRGRLYFKGGEQLLRGFFEGDDFVGFGGELAIETRSFTLETELDLRQLDSPDGFESLDRGRFLLDFRHRFSRFEWGVGGYVQGEDGSFDEIPDVYDTAGIGATFSWKKDSDKTLGLWMMWEDDAPDLHIVNRLAFFYRTPNREYGVGVRRDEIGPSSSKEENFGPFFFFEVPFRNLILKGDVGVQDSDAQGSDVYGKLSLNFKR